MGALYGMHRPSDGSPLRMIEIMVTADGKLITENTPPTSGAGSPVVRGAILTRPTASGTVAAGAQSVSVANPSSIIASVAGAFLKPGESVTWQANGNDTLAAINYTITSGGELLISEVR